QAAADREPITAIATRFGFIHFGRFSSQYRRAFGEAPSTTRRKAISEATSAVPPTAKRQPRADQPVLAILPMVSSSADPDQNAFANALAESIGAAFAGERQISAMLAPTGLVQRRNIP